jgi:hypothetical protein
MSIGFVELCQPIGRAAFGISAPNHVARRVAEGGYYIFILGPQPIEHFYF